MSSAKRLFLSCAPEDEPLREKLEKHLSPLERSGEIAVWHTGKVLPGDDAAHAIGQQLTTADVVLLLITPDFLASDSIHDEQLRPALARRETAGARVVPILVKPCAWRTSALAKLAALPKNQTPIMLWPHPDEAWADVVDSLLEVLAHFPSQLQSSVSNRSLSNAELPDALQQASRSSTSGGDASVAALRARLAAVAGVWLDEGTSSTYCIRVLDGHIRACYCYRGDDHLVGEFHHCSLVGNKMVARYRWMDRRVQGYACVRFQGRDEATGGWWLESTVPDWIKADPSRLDESLPGMTPYKWIRLKFIDMPTWAETFFSECQWIA